VAAWRVVLATGRTAWCCLWEQWVSGSGLARACLAYTLGAVLRPAQACSFKQITARGVHALAKRQPCAGAYADMRRQKGRTEGVQHRAEPPASLANARKSCTRARSRTRTTTHTRPVGPGGQAGGSRRNNKTHCVHGAPSHMCHGRVCVEVGGGNVRWHSLRAQARRRCMLRLPHPPTHNHGCEVGHTTMCMRLHHHAVCDRHA
jgi:hypothetical protein